METEVGPFLSLLRLPPHFWLPPALLIQIPPSSQVFKFSGWPFLCMPITSTLGKEPRVVPQGSELVLH